jgi:hypothetical protein
LAILLKVKDDIFLVGGVSIGAILVEGEMDNCTSCLLLQNTSSISSLGMLELSEEEKATV